MKAKDFLKKGKSAIVIFTNGIHFRRNRDGTGWTAYWIVGRHRRFEQVIIYKRNRRLDESQVFVADFVSRKARPKDGRFTLALKNISKGKLTNKNWLEFAHGSRNPVQYLG